MDMELNHWQSIQATRVPFRATDSDACHLAFGGHAPSATHATRQSRTGTHNILTSPHSICSTALVKAIVCFQILTLLKSCQFPHSNDMANLAKVIGINDNGPFCSGRYLIKHAVVVQVMSCCDGLQLSLRQVLALQTTRSATSQRVNSIKLCTGSQRLWLAEASNMFSIHIKPRPHHACEGVSELGCVQPLVSVRVKHLKDLSNGPKHLRPTPSHVVQPASHWMAAAAT